MLQPKITPFLWFDSEAEEAANFYCSIFEHSRILDVARYPDGKVLTVTFELEGLQVTALNGGPQFGFTEAFSFSVSCDDQAEVDRLWDVLTANGGEESQCAWLKDRFGLSWQIVPKILPRLLGDPDPERANAVMQAMLQMRKIEIPVLQEAYDRVKAHA
jgi:predicted 3-demethylubiquinone-9 3-methyltransferase (glyoxalase superfamily)